MDHLVERLKKLVLENCQAVIDENHPLTVESVGGSENIIFEVHCDKDDVGLVIGRNGKNVEAIRTLVRAACRGAALRTSVEICNSR